MGKINNKLIIIIIVLLINPYSVIVSSKTFANEKEDQVVEITTVEQLNNIIKDMDGQYILMNDIDLKGIEWSPIGGGAFTGSLIGNHYEIKNMSAKYMHHENRGLFDKIDDSSVMDVQITFNEEFENELEDIEAKMTFTEETNDQNFERITKESISTENAPVIEEDIPYEKQCDEDMYNEREDKAVRRSVNVDDFSQFKNALESADVSEINLTGDIEASAGILKRISIEPRELVVNGNGHEIKQNSKGISSYSMMKVNNSSAGESAKLTFRDVIMYSEKNSLFTESGSHDWELIFENVNTGVFAESTGSIVNADYAHVRLSETVNFISNELPTFNGAKSVTISPHSDVEILAKGGQFYTSGVTNAELLVQGNLKIEAQRSESSVIDLGGNDSNLNIDGGTLNIYSNRVYNTIKNSSDQLTSGLIRLTGSNATLNVDNAGDVQITHQQGTILYMESENGHININGKGTNVSFVVNGEGNDTNHDAPIHLNRVSDKVKGYEFSLDGGASFEVIKQSGSAMGVRVGQGTQHKVTIKGGSKFKVHNKGDGVARDPAGENGRNQALYYNGELPEFNLSGKGSEVELIADYGVAMHMTGGGIINVNEGSTIIARGRTASADRGIIDTGGVDDIVRSKITLTKPAFYDFKNNNTEGYVFHVGGLAEIEGNETDIALWERGPDVNLNGPHTFRFLSVYRYIYRGENFKTLSAAATTSTGLKEVQAQYKYGLREFSRISGNNAQAVVNDLYIPTNADQKIYAHVSVDEGIFGKRDAYTDEVEVDILHTRQSGNQQLYQGRTIGGDAFPNQEAYEIYNKSTESFGWVEIDIPEDSYLKAGETIEVIGARIIDSTSNKENTTESGENNLFSGKRTTIDVTPPNPTTLRTEKLTEESTSIAGSLTEEDAQVVVEVNGIVDEGIVEYDGDELTFNYTFGDQLTIGDKVQVLLYDQAGKAEELGPEANQPDRPITNKEFGNMNPVEPYAYHDRVFEAGPIVEVVRAPGELSFVSIPSTLHFQAKITSYTKDYHVNMEEMENDLIIKDTREVKNNWTLTARLSNELTGVKSERNKLKNALIYKEESSEVIIGTEDAIIKTHMYEQSDAPNGEWNISSHSETGWGEEGRGLFIRIDPETMKDEYKGEVIWTLHDTP